MFLVSLENPTIEAPTLELFAQRTDGWTQERFDFGLRLTRPAQRPKQCACRQVSSGKAIPDEKWPSLERLVEPVKRQQEAPFSNARGLGADVHHLRHRAPNRCKREREQRTLQPGRIPAYKSQGPLTIRQRVVVEPKAQRHANFLVQVFLPLDRSSCILRIRWCEAWIRKGLFEEIDDLSGVLDHRAVGFENR